MIRAVSGFPASAGFSDADWHTYSARVYGPCHRAEKVARQAAFEAATGRASGTVAEGVQTIPHGNHGDNLPSGCAQ